MTDQFDRASELEAEHRQRALDAHKNRAAAPKLQPVGFYHNCDEVLLGNAPHPNPLPEGEGTSCTGTRYRAER